MSDLVRGNTLLLAQGRFFVERSISFEQVYSINCVNERSDSLVLCCRTEISSHSDGATSSDIHKDIYCSGHNCDHIIVRTEIEKKTMKYKPCSHNPNRVGEVRRKITVWEGDRKNVGDPYLEMTIPEPANDCEECLKEEYQGREHPPIPVRATAQTLLRLEEFLKRFCRLDKHKPKGARTTKQLYKYLVKDRKGEPWLRADLLKSRAFSDIKHRRVTNIFYEADQCWSSSFNNGHVVSHHERTEEATFYSGATSFDIHSDYYCDKLVCKHTVYNNKTVTKDMSYAKCFAHDKNICEVKTTETKNLNPRTSLELPVGQPHTTRAQCPACRKNQNPPAAYIEGRRRKRDQLKRVKQTAKVKPHRAKRI